jgi:hypothetical protein
VPLPQPTEAAETTATVAVTGVEEVVVDVAGSLPPHRVTTGDDEVRVPDEPAAVIQEQTLLRTRQGPPPRRSMRSRKRERLC